GLGDVLLLDLLPLSKRHDMMPRAKRAIVQNALATQGNDRDEHDHKPQPRVVRLQLGGSPAGLADVQAHLDATTAVIASADSIDRGGHDLDCGCITKRMEWDEGCKGENQN